MISTDKHFLATFALQFPAYTNFTFPQTPQQSYGFPNKQTQLLPLRKLLILTMQQAGETIIKLARRFQRK